MLNFLKGAGIVLLATLGLALVVAGMVFEFTKVMLMIDFVKWLYAH